MRALWLERGALALRDDVELPTPRAGEVRVQVLRAGICATDLALARGYMNFTGVPGHEFVGLALEGQLRGQRVVGEINAACGHCADCRADNQRHCAARTVLGIAGRHGAFAQQLLLPETNLLAVPDTVSTDAATFTEPLAAALQIGTQVDLRRVERALVVGDGKLGILCAQALCAAGVEVTVAGRHTSRAALVAPARHVVGWFEGDRPPPHRFDLAVEASANPLSLPRLLRCMRPRGTVVLKTTSEQPMALDLAHVVVDELTLLGSRCGRFAPALEALARGTVRVEGLIAARYPLAQGEAAFHHAQRRGTLKVLLEIDAAAGSSDRPGAAPA